MIFLSLTAGSSREEEEEGIQSGIYTYSLRTLFWAPVLRVPTSLAINHPSFLFPFCSTTIRFSSALAFGPNVHERENHSLLP